MGFLGALLYYPVSFLFTKYPTLNDWTGDWVWPATIVVGILWSIGFLLAGIVYHFLKKWITSTLLLRVLYIAILWLWAAFLWYITISNNLEMN